MTAEQLKQLTDFEIFTRWMYDDCKKSLVEAGAQYLVAMGLFNYIETLGTLLLGYYQADGKSRTKPEKRFNAFFSYLGNDYAKLVDEHPEIYDELRCGLTHEMLPKNRKFTLAQKNAPGRIPILNFQQIRPSFSSPSDVLEAILTPSDLKAPGVFFIKNDNEEKWFILVPNLCEDFESGVKKLILEIKTSSNPHLVSKFFDTMKHFNFENF